MIIYHQLQVHPIHLIKNVIYSNLYYYLNNNINVSR